MCVHMHRKRWDKKWKRKKIERITSLARKIHPPARHWLPNTTVTTRSNWREEREEKTESKEKRCVYNFVHNTYKISSKVSTQEKVTGNHFHAHIHPGPHSTHIPASNTHHQEGKTSYWAEPQTPALSQGRICSFSAKSGSRTTYNQELF